jgi:hypothetical protein
MDKMYFSFASLHFAIGLYAAPRCGIVFWFQCDLFISCLVLFALSLIYFFHVPCDSLCLAGGIVLYIVSLAMLHGLISVSHLLLALCLAFGSCLPVPNKPV